MKRITPPRPKDGRQSHETDTNQYLPYTACTCFRILRRLRNLSASSPFYIHHFGPLYKLLPGPRPGARSISTAEGSRDKPTAKAMYSEHASSNDPMPLSIQRYLKTQSEHEPYPMSVRTSFGPPIDSTFLHSSTEDGAFANQLFTRWFNKPDLPLVPAKSRTTKESSGSTVSYHPPRLDLMGLDLMTRELAELEICVNAYPRGLGAEIVCSVNGATTLKPPGLLGSAADSKFALRQSPDIFAEEDFNICMLHRTRKIGAGEFAILKSFVHEESCSPFEDSAYGSGSAASVGASEATNVNLDETRMTTKRQVMAMENIDVPCGPYSHAFSQAHFNLDDVGIWPQLPTFLTFLTPCSQIADNISVTSISDFNLRIEDICIDYDLHVHGYVNCNTHGEAHVEKNPHTNGLAGTSTVQPQKKRARKESDDGSDDGQSRYPEDGDDGGESELGQNTIIEHGGRFACPFFKKDPAIYGQGDWKRCGDPGWKDIPSLK